MKHVHRYPLVTQVSTNVSTWLIKWS